jgi:hypothetical protein
LFFIEIAGGDDFIAQRHAEAVTLSYEPAPYEKLFTPGV